MNDMTTEAIKRNDMQTLISRYAPLCPVRFPKFKARQFYMHEFNALDMRMPEGFEDYTPVVQKLCAAAGFREGVAYLTVDEKIIKPGMSQRRPGPHVDGQFIKNRNRWGHGGWNHHCNEVPLARMPIIVAASVAGCKAWHGDFVGEPRNDGDLSHLSLGEGELLPENFGFLLSPDCVHESIRFEHPTQRSFLRIALPVGFSGAKTP